MKTRSYALRLALRCLFALGVSSLPAFGQADEHRVNLSVGEIRDVTVSFPVLGFEPGNKDIIRVQLSGDQKVSVTGLKEGQTDLKVRGDGDSSETFKITVGSSLAAVLAEVRKDIDSIPGVEAEISLSTIVLRGVVTRPQDLAYLRKTVIPAYAGQISARFHVRIHDDVLLQVKRDLTKAGFTVRDGVDNPTEPGDLNLYSSENNLMVGGTVYSRHELDSIRTVVAANPWLKLKRDDGQPGDDAFYALVNVNITPVNLELDVAFVGVTEEEATTVGMNVLRNGLAVIEGGFRVVGSTVAAARGSGSYVVSGGMNETLKAVSGGGPGRFISRGHITFKNEATEWKLYQDGGTIVLPIYGGTTGGVGVQPIDYGLILRTKGGMVDRSNAELDLQLELSAPVPIGTSPGGPIYNLKRNRVESTAPCPIGKTLIIAGSTQLTEGVNVKSSTPGLGKVPILQFLFSEREKTKTDRQVLILISPQLARTATNATRLSDETIAAEGKANEPLSIYRAKIKK